MASLDVSLSFSYSCLAVPNRFDYPDPALPLRSQAPAKLPSAADAIQTELQNAVLMAGSLDIVEAQFKDGSTMRFRSAPSGLEVQVDRMESRASHYAERLASVAREGRAIKCHFSDGSSIRIVPFG